MTSHAAMRVSLRRLSSELPGTPPFPPAPSKSEAKREGYAERRSRMVLPEGSRRTGRPNSDRRRRRFQSDRDQAVNADDVSQNITRAASHLVLRSEYNHGQRSG